MKKRTICLLLAMIMVLSIVLAGCSKTAETPAADETPATTEPAETTDNTETPEAPEETAEPALEQKTIQLMITGAGKQANSDKVWAAFNEQLQQYVPNTTVEFIDVPFEEYSEKFSQVLASGEGVDLAWTGWLINKPQNIADGNLMPLDDLLAEYGQGIVDVLGENVVEIHRNADGNIYYLPSWQGLCGERRGWLVVTEIAELAGDTWIEDTEAALNKWRNNYTGIEDFQAVLDQATKYLAAAKEAGKLGAGINTGRAFGWSMYNGMYSFLGVGGAEIGITYCDGTFTVKDGVAGEHYKLYAKTMADWYKEGYIRSDMVSKSNNNGGALPTATPAPTGSPTTKPSATYTTLRLGSTGDAVTRLVQELINQGYYTGSVTNVYTSAVQAAVRAFQSAKGLTVDGIAGKQTQHALFGTVEPGADDYTDYNFQFYPAEKIDWYTGGIQQLWAKGASYKIYDVRTGIVWWARRWAGYSHADIEPVTAADTARLCQIYGVNNAQEIWDKNLWQRRPCLITIGNRTFACSLFGMPHNPDGDTIPDNNMTGQICMHFTNSKGHESGKVDTYHQQAIEYAWQNCPAGHK